MRQASRARGEGKAVSRTTARYLLGVAFVVASVGAATITVAGCESAVQNVGDRISGVTPSERLGRDWKEFENRRVNENPNAPSFQCVDGLVASGGPLGGPIGGARVEVFADDEPTSASAMTTSSNGEVRVCVAPHRQRVRLEIAHPRHGSRTVAYRTADPPARLDVVLPR